MTLCHMLTTLNLNTDISLSTNKGELATCRSIIAGNWNPYKRFDI